MWVCCTKWKSLEEKQSFYDEVKCELNVHSPHDFAMCLDDFNGYVGRHVHGFDEVHGGYGVGQRNLEGSMLLEFFMVKELCVSITWLKREEMRKVIFRIGENETEIDFVLIEKDNQWFIQDVKAFPGEFQHALVIADVDKGLLRR